MERKDRRPDLNNSTAKKDYQFDLINDELKKAEDIERVYKKNIKYN